MPPEACRLEHQRKKPFVRRNMGQPKNGGDAILKIRAPGNFEPKPRRMLFPARFYSAPYNVALEEPDLSLRLLRSQPRITYASLVLGPPFTCAAGCTQTAGFAGKWMERRNDLGDSKSLIGMKALTLLRVSRATNIREHSAEPGTTLISFGFQDVATKDGNDGSQIGPKRNLAHTLGSPM
ncbi:hypothetical protein V5O48_013131 [Marasmius crinis-equi]|uniref:Uncharacterized protein n=1 Tax=Marasmius crinis-equi TaxID=585013 RepID=A0ABR3F0X3_9AGAR